MATGAKREICVFGLTQIGGAVGQAPEWTNRLPYERRTLVHQKPSKKFARACKAEEIFRMNAYGDLIPYSPSAMKKEKENYVRGTTRRGSIDIVYSALLDDVSCKVLHRLVDVSWLVVERH